MGIKSETEAVKQIKYHEIRLGEHVVGIVTIVWQDCKTDTIKEDYSKEIIGKILGP